MSATPLRVCVIGGNGFVGSAVCRAALKRKWDVVSLSRTGTPYTSPGGHRPAWTQSVDWRSGSAYDASDLARTLAGCDAAVHTLGILLESDYKGGRAYDILAGMSLNPVDWVRGRPSPLEGGVGRYEHVNRDSAISVLNAFAAMARALPRSTPRPFAYLSAEDVFRPVIPARYIESKRAAERAIDDLALANPGLLRPLFIRPTLIYHPHIRPMTTLPATMIDLSAQIQRRLPRALQARTLAQIAPVQLLNSLARLVSTPPVHLDTVAEAVCRSIERDDMEGVVNVQTMRQLVGFRDGAEAKGEMPPLTL